MKPEEILFLLFLICSGISTAAALRAMVLKLRARRNSSRPSREESARLNGRPRRRYTPEQLARLRDPKTGHLRSRSWVMQKAVELRRSVTGYDSRECGSG